MGEKVYHEMLRCATQSKALRLSVILFFLDTESDLIQTENIRG